MKDFIKIFFGISALVAAFMFGSNYGEKTYNESSEHKNLVKATEELNIARADLENVKIKLQNITDRAETKKTDELLAQILHVFLTDLGLTIQNRDAILKQAQQLHTPPVAAPKTEPKTEAPVVTEVIESPKPIAKFNMNKLKSYEWMVQNSGGGESTIRDLKKVEIKNLNAYLKQADYQDASDCEQLLGVYKGSVKNINLKNFGSLEFELKVGQTKQREELYGKTAWYFKENSISEKIDNNCGKKIKGLGGRIFNLAADKYIQIYKLNNAEKTAGNFYEVLPNGTSKVLGSFVLNRVDRF